MFINDFWFTAVSQRGISEILNEWKYKPKQSFDAIADIMSYRRMHCGTDDLQKQHSLQHTCLSWRRILQLKGGFPQYCSIRGCLQRPGWERVSFGRRLGSICQFWLDQQEKVQRTLGFLLCLFVSQMSEVQRANNKASATVTTAVIILSKDRWFRPTAIITLIKSDAL